MSLKIFRKRQLEEHTEITHEFLTSYKNNKILFLNTLQGTYVSISVKHWQEVQ